MFISHRGNDNHLYRENSLQAISYSLNQPYISGVECDIRLTLDNKLVLSHNSFVYFGLSGHKFIHNTTLQELLSYRYSNGDQITVLCDLLSVIQTDKIILLEIKEEHDRTDEWVMAIEVIKNRFSHLNIYICSFNYVLLCKLKDHLIDIPIGLIVGSVINAKKDTSSFEFIMYHYNNFKYIHKKSFVWTVNTKDLYNRFKHKVDYIITDKAYALL